MQVNTRYRNSTRGTSFSGIEVIQAPPPPSAKDSAGWQLMCFWNQNKQLKSRNLNFSIFRSIFLADDWLATVHTFIYWYICPEHRHNHDHNDWLATVCTFNYLYISPEWRHSHDHNGNALKFNQLALAEWLYFSREISDAFSACAILWFGHFLWFYLM